jgi:hypothetical protein
MKYQFCIHMKRQPDSRVGISRIVQVVPRGDEIV